MVTFVRACLLLHHGGQFQGLQLGSKSWKALAISILTYYAILSYGMIWFFSMVFMPSSMLLDSGLNSNWSHARISRNSVRWRAIWTPLSVSD
jgi:hypothetical protein